MKRAFIFFAAAAMLLIDASPLWTQGEPISLEEIWRRQDTKLTYFTVCKQGRMVVMSKSNTNPNKPLYLYLIDLTTGENVYATNPDSEKYIFANYLGDKFYVYNYIDSILREYDTESKSLLRELLNIPITGFGTKFISPDNEFVQFDNEKHILLFTDLYTGIVKDSFQIEGSPQDPKSFISWGRDFTPDNRYFNYSSKWLLDNNNPVTFHIYDRQTREIIFKRTTPIGSNFRYQYFNTSNKIAFAEEVQLPGDDKVYSYIRIFDPDTRTIVKDIKISEYPYLYFVPNYDDTKIIYTVSDPQQHGLTLIYDLENDRFSDFKFIIDGGTLFADTNALYTFNGLFLAAYKFDWTVGVDDRISQELNVIYPNPTNGIVSLNVSPEFVMGRWNVSDMQGRILKKGLIGHANSLVINLSDIIPGTYYLILTKNDRKNTYKLIKQ